MSQVTSPRPVRNAAQEIDQDEPRTATRRRMLKSGVICFNERHSTLPCAVRDVSDLGARLKLTGSIDAPDTFELFIELDGIRVDCEVIWRGKNEIGAKFTSEKRQEKPKRKQVLVQQFAVPKKPSLRRKPIRK